MKKKIFSFLIALCMILPMAFMLTACKEPDPASRVLTVELNPEVEFVLDSNNKVVTVNALNDDGYAVVTADVDFSGLSAEDAVDLFLETANELGFVVDAAGEEVTISISGENAEKLYNKVKASAQQVLQSINVENITIDFDAIDKEDLMEEVEKCFTEYTENQLNGMTEEELIAKLKQSREETKDLLNQKAKELYYLMRENEILVAKMEALHINADALIAQFNTVKQSFINNYLKDTSVYKTELEEYIAAKKDFLAENLKADPNFTEIMTRLEAVNLDSIQEQIHEAMDSIVDTLNQQMEVAKGLIESTIDMLTTFNPEIINNAVNTAITELQAQFTTGDLSQYNFNLWADAPAA